MADASLFIELQSGVFIPKRLVDTGDGYWAEKVKSSITDFPALSSASDSVSLEGGLATYTHTNSLTPTSAGAFDIVGIEPSATMVTRLLRLRLWMKQTAAAVVDLRLAKRSTLTTTGTSGVNAGVSHVAAGPGSTAVIRSWSNTSGQTLGTLTGYIALFEGNIPTAYQEPPLADYDWRNKGEQYYLLPPSPATQGIYLQSAVALAAGFALFYEWTWTESLT